MEWSNYVEKIYGKFNAPGLPENKDNFARKRKKNEYRLKKGNKANNIQKIVEKKRKVLNKSRFEIYEGKLVLYLFCKIIMEFGKCFSNHLRKKYRGRFKFKIYYPKYLKLDKKVAIFGRYNWNRYISEVYNGDNGVLFVNNLY